MHRSLEMNPKYWWLRLLFSILIGLVYGDPASLDCPLRSIGLEYSQMLQPFRPTEAFQEIADALNGSPEAQHCQIKPSPLNTDTKPWSSRVGSFPLPSLSEDEAMYFVCPKTGSDSPKSLGSRIQPFRSIEYALHKIRHLRSLKGYHTPQQILDSPPPRVYLILRSGTFHLSSPIQFTTLDSYITIQSYPHEQATISGALPVDGVIWEPIPPPKRQEYEELPGLLDDGFDIYPPNDYTYQEAVGICTRLSLCTGFDRNGSDPDTKAYTRFKYNNFYKPDKSHFTYVKNRGYMPDIKPSLYVANVSSLAFSASIESLRVNGKRMIRARYPNVPNVELLGAMQLWPLSWTAQSNAPVADYTFNPASPVRNDSADDLFQTFRIGVGGECASRFQPQASYWCSNNSQGGGPGPYSAPVGMKARFPHGPYDSDITRANIFTWRQDRWFSWVFKVDSMDYDEDTEITTFSFSQTIGGNQGSRGGDKGEEFFIDNILEELDAPGEFYHDIQNHLLYVWFNDTDMPTSSDIGAAVVQELIVTKGSQEHPVKALTFKGIIFADTAPAFLEPHGTPSGGDWAVARNAALFFEGTEDLVVDSCYLTRIDGNALFLSGYTRNAQITRNEFYSIGESCILSWGYTDGSPVPGMGYDATSGNQPRASNISYNLFHEMGIFTKQNSAIFQSESFDNTYFGNIGYNGPRAGVNFNDGMGGGSSLERSVLFNFCRESSDHGNFNSWNRQVYLVDDSEGNPSTSKRNDTIAYNWMLANYHSSMAIDNDDGSAYYDTHHNVLISASSDSSYGGNSLKADYGGHDNFHHDNLDLFWTAGFDICTANKGHADGYYNNYLYMMQDGDYGRGQQCEDDDESSKTIVFNNQIWSPTATITECGKPLQKWQSLGNDVGTTVSTYPKDEVVLDIARNLLGLDSDIVIDDRSDHSIDIY